MGKIFLWFVLVVICILWKVDGGHVKSSKLVNNHKREAASQSKNDLNAKNPSERSDSSSKLEKNINVKKNGHHGLSDSTENVNTGKQTIANPKITDEGRISTEDYLKTLTSAQPIQVSKHSETNGKQSDSRAVENIKSNSENDKSDDEREDASLQKKSEISTPIKTEREQNNEQKKSKIEIPKKTKLKENLNARESNDKVLKSEVEKTFKSDTKSPVNNKKDDLQHSNAQKVEKTLTENKTAEGHAKHTIRKTADNSESKSQAKASVGLSHSTTKTQPLKAEEADLVKTENKTRADGDIQKKAKKFLASFFHSELNDERGHGKKTHVINENKNGKQSSGVDSHNSNTQHAEGAHEKKTHVMKDNGHDGQSTEDDLPSTHTKDEESTLAEISDKLYKRTGLQQVTNFNNKVIETVLPSGPHAEAPQHIRLSSEPTHVMFKPVHRYYPAIHRYMNKPIHRYLKKPVDLSGITQQPLEGGPAFTTTPQVKEYTNTPLIQHSVGIPKVVADNLASVSGSSGAKGLPLEAKQFTSPPGPVVQQVPEGLVNDQSPAPQVRHYDGGASPRIVPGGLVHAHHVAPGGAAPIGPVRIFTQLPPRIQPVLMHPHRFSQTG